VWNDCSQTSNKAFGNLDKDKLALCTILEQLLYPIEAIQIYVLNRLIAPVFSGYDDLPTTMLSGHSGNLDQSAMSGVINSISPFFSHPHESAQLLARKTYLRLLVAHWLSSRDEPRNVPISVPFLSAIARSSETFQIQVLEDIAGALEGDSRYAENSRQLLAVTRELINYGVMTKVLLFEDQNIQLRAIEVFRHIEIVGRVHRALAESGTYSSFLRLLSHSALTVQLAVIRRFRFLMTKYGYTVDFLVQTDCLVTLVSLVSHGVEEVENEALLACGAIVALCSIPSRQYLEGHHVSGLCKAVMQAQIIPTIAVRMTCATLNVDVLTMLVKAVVHCLSSNSKEMFDAALGAQCIPGIVTLLSSPKEGIRSAVFSTMQIYKDGIIRQNGGHFAALRLALILFLTAGGCI
jgi:hypothetical protein